MPMAPFHWRFGDLALRELRSISVRGRHDLPDGEFALLESYCDELGWDWRRVLFQIFARGEDQPLAFVGYGWEAREYYARRSGDPDFDYCGPYLEPMTRQLPHAKGLLKLVQIALTDADYVNRLRRHYAMFKQTVAGASPESVIAGSKPGG